VDTEGAAVEQLHKEGTSLGGPWRPDGAADPAKRSRGQEGIVVRNLEQECQDSSPDSASSKSALSHDPVFYGLSYP
jgi:hypothetical protein